MHLLRLVNSKKRLMIFLSPAAMSLTELSLARNNKYLFPARESLVCDIQAGDGKIDNLFYSVPRAPFLMQKTALFWHGLGQFKKFNFLLLPLFYLRRPHISSNTSVDKFLRIFYNKLR
jgi:hypothetical protein